ncbi:hypothetical protein OPT61_g6354 [Boeremia exigua]|uniref:Uncharacterized protein n=1 Tax=Boeremia exigua TaxID=749465 RepID=A0ACC2I725_9PLEO|nr:hypothetical protein OPT61_g6354 [Boeremia exigua]
MQGADYSALRNVRQPAFVAQGTRRVCFSWAHGGACPVAVAPRNKTKTAVRGPWASDLALQDVSWEIAAARAGIAQIPFRSCRFGCCQIRSNARAVEEAAPR